MSTETNMKKCEECDKTYNIQVLWDTTKQDDCVVCEGRKWCWRCILDWEDDETGEEQKGEKVKVSCEECGVCADCEHAIECSQSNNGVETAKDRSIADSREETTGGVSRQGQRTDEAHGLWGDGVWRLHDDGRRSPEGAIQDEAQERPCDGRPDARRVSLLLYPLE